MEVVPKNLLRLYFKTTLLIPVVVIILSIIVGVTTLSLLYVMKLLLLEELRADFNAVLMTLSALTALILASLASARINAMHSSSCMLSIRRWFARALLSANYSRLEMLGLNRLHDSFSEDVGKISIALNVMPSLINQLVVLILGFTFLLFLSVELFLVCIIPLLLFLFIMEYYLAPRVRRSAKKARNSFLGVSRRVNELVYGNKELRADYNRRKYQRDVLFEDSILELSGQAKLRDSLNSIYSTSSIAVSFLIILNILFYMSLTSDQDKNVLVFVIVLLYLRGPMVTVINLMPHMRVANVALSSLRGLCLSDFASQEYLLEPLNFSDSLSLREIAYRYENSDEKYEFALKNVAFDIKKGSICFITGGNGSGKTTLLKVLMALYKPSAGEILVDGRAVRADEYERYCALISPIYSDFFLFDQDLHRTESGLAAEEVEKLLVQFHLNTVVQYQDQYYKFSQLSTGQRKRLAFVMALAEDRPILMLDEWAAEQDPSFRELFYTELLPQLKRSGKTIIAITHDDHYFEVADMIVELHQGSVSAVSRP